MDEEDDGAVAIASIREGWDLTTWSRELPAEIRIRPSRRAELTKAVADVADDTKVRLAAAEVRALLAAADRPKVRGARIEGVNENAGVIYLVTVQPEEPRRLQTVEVIGDNPRAFRIPVRLLEDLTRYVLAAQDAAAAEDGSDPNDVVIWAGRPSDGVPSAEDLRDFVARGLTAAGIAKLIDRTEGRVYQLLREARRERPDLNWPPVSKGPKTTDGK